MSGPTAWWRRLQQLRSADYRETARAAGCIVRVWFCLRRSSLPEMLGALDLQQAFPEASPEAIARSNQVTRWAHHLLPIRPNCLLDSLAAALWLRSRRLSVPLMIGVRNSQGQVEAHAWLEGSEAAGGDFRVIWRSQGTPQ